MPWSTRSRLLGEIPRGRSRLSGARLGRRWFGFAVVAAGLIYAAYGVLTQRFELDGPAHFLYWLHDTVALAVYGWLWTYPAPYGIAAWGALLGLSGAGLLGYLTGRSLLRSLQVRLYLPVIRRRIFHPALLLWHGWMHRGLFSPELFKQLVDFDRLDALEEIDGDVRDTHKPAPKSAYSRIVASVRLELDLSRHESPPSLRGIALAWEAYVRLFMVVEEPDIANTRARRELAVALRQAVGRIRLQNHWESWRPVAGSTYLETPALLRDIDCLLDLTEARRDTGDASGRMLSPLQLRRTTVESVRARIGILNKLAVKLSTTMSPPAGEPVEGSNESAAAREQARWVSRTIENIALLTASVARLPELALSHVACIDSLSLLASLSQARGETADDSVTDAALALTDGYPTESACVRTAALTATYRGDQTEAARELALAASDLLGPVVWRCIDQPVTRLHLAGARDAARGDVA